MEGMKVIYKEDDVYLCTPVEVPLRPEEVLGKFISQFPKIPGLYGKFKVDGKTMEGYTISKAAQKLRKFWERYSLTTKTPFLDSTDFRALEEYTEFTSLPEYVVLRHENEEYIFKKSTSIALYSWLEEEGKIRPVWCGVCNAGGYSLYFYFSGYSEKKAIFRTTEHYVNLPKSIRDGLSKGYRCIEINEGETHPFFHRRVRLTPRERYGSNLRAEDELVDLLPYPPYRIVHAIKLLPPDEVEKAKPLELGEEFKEVYILKTFLYSLEPLPVSVLSPGQLKKIAGYIHSPLYLPDTPNEDALSEYSQIWEKSVGYLLWCKPNWPF